MFTPYLIICPQRESNHAGPGLKQPTYNPAGDLGAMIPLNYRGEWEYFCKEI